MKQKNTSEDPMRRILEDIETGTYCRCYLLYGTESYLIRQYREKLVSALVPEGDTMNCSTFSGKDFREEDLIALSETMPFFSEHRVIILEDSGLFQGKSELLPDYMARIPESTVFVFTEYPSADAKNPTNPTARTTDKRSRMYKAVTKYGFAAQLNTPSDRDLLRWTAGRIRKENKKISDHTLRLFLERTGPDMNRIENELEKLLCFCMDQNHITDADVDAVCIIQPEDRIFDMIDAVSMKNREKAFSLYADLIALRTPPGRILYLLSNQYLNLLHVCERKEAGMGKAQIRSETGLRDFVIDKCSRIGSRYTLQELQTCLHECVQAEEAFKTGKISDQMSLELLIAKLSA